jgi:hypothetical protein
MKRHRWLLIAFLSGTSCAKPSSEATLSDGGADEEDDGTEHTGSGGTRAGTGGTTGDGAATGGSSQGTGGVPSAAGADPVGTGGQGTGGLPPEGATPVDEALYGTLALQDASIDTQQQIKFTLANNSGRDLDLASVSIRYWFTPANSVASTVVDCDDAALNDQPLKESTTFTLVDGTQPYLLIDFTKAATFTFWGTTEPVGEINRFQIRLHDTNYQGDDLTDDYSYQATPGPNEKITVYYAGLLVWGQEPPL